MAEAWLEQAAANLTAKPAALPENRNWLEEAHQSLVSMEDARLRTSVNNALKSNPDEAARTKLGALTVGVPLDVAERQPQVVDLAKQNNILQKLQDTEYTKKAFANPDFAKIAHDDVDNLSFWERIGDGLKRGTTSVGVTAEAMGYFIDKTLSDIGSMTLPKPRSMTDEQWAAAQEKIQVGRGAGGLSIAAKAYGAIPQDPKMKEFASVVEQQPTTMGGIGEGMAYLAQNPSVFGVLFAEQVAPLTAFGVPAGFAVSPIRKAVTDRLTNEAVKRYVAATVPMAALQFGTNAGMTFGGEMAEGISRGLTPEAAAGRASIKSVVEGAVNAAFAFAPVPVGTTRLKKAGTVVAESVKQGVAGATGATAAAAAVGEEISLAEQMLEFFGEFTTAPVDIATAALSDPGAASIVRDAAAARQAQATAAMMEQVGQAAQEGKLGKRSPEDLKQFVDGMETPEVYIEAREFAKYFQELGVDPRQVASEITGVAEQFDEAVASGGDLRMTMGDYASKIAATEHHAALAQHIRTDPDGMTPAQATKWEQEYGQELQGRADKILAETEERDPITASADQVRDQITQQITSAGKFDERAAKQKAELHRAFSIVMGKELGIMPHEVYERYGLQFRVPPPSAEPTPPPGEAVAGGTLYQETESKKRRGSISMAEDITQAPSVISLFEGADLSTVLHETGHFFFEVYKDIASRPDAPEKVKADMAALLSFVGVDSLDKWNSMSIEERRAGHEKVAEAFEVYLFEGKAPSEDMKSLFRTYRAWLVQVYRNIKDYLSPEKITPEVRSVFDRMLASDEQIAATQKARSFIPLFTREEFTNEEEWQKYQDTVTAQTDDAVEKLERRSLRDLKWLDNAKSKEMKRLQEAGKEVRAGVKAEVDVEVRNRPVYQAMRFLSHGELADLEGLNRDARRAITEAGLTTTKLSSEALKAQYGDAPAAKWRYMPTGRYGWRTEKGGLDPDAVAEWFGFSSGDALVNALLEAEKMNTLIESITDQRMLEEHADLSDPQAIEDAANDAIHNEAHTRMVATELAKLDKKVGNLKMLLKASDEYARERIAKMKVRDLKPLQYLAAEGRAAKNAMTLLVKGDRDGAAQAKRDQLLSGRLYRAAIEAQQNNEKALAYFKKFEKPEYLKRIDPDEQEAIVELLGRYDLRKSVTLKDIDLKEHVRQLAEDGEITEFTDIPEWVLTDKKSYKELTIEELEGLYETVRMLAAVGRNKKELIAGEERIAFEDAINEMETVADKAIPKGVPNPIDKATLSMLQKAGETMRGFNAPLVKVEQLAQFLDGGIPNGPFAKYIFEPMAQAENARNKIDANALYKVVEMLDGLDGKRLMQQYEIKSLPKIDGKSQSLSVESIMTVALNLGNESNEFKLKDGYDWTDDQVREIVSHLTSKEWEIVQGIWGAIGELWPQIVEVERSITGIAPKGVDPRPFTTPSGQQLKGGYFPVVYDPRFSAAGLKQAEAKAGAVEGQTGFFRPKVADGFTKKRITGAAGRILLTGGLSIIPQHLSEVSHLVSHKKALRDAWKLLSNRKVQGIIKDKLGVDAYNQFTSWAHAVANGRAVTDDVGARAWGKWLGKLRRNISLVAMGFKYTTAAAQLAGITASMEIFRQRSAENQVMGIGYLRKGVGEFTRHPFQSAKFVFSKSEQMNNRVNSFDRNVRENFERAVGKQGTMDFIRLLSMKHIGYMDMSIAIPTWTGAYRWAIDQELTETEAVAHADKVVRLALGSGGVKDLNAAQRSASLQFVTLFFSYFATYHGRLTSILRDARSENEILKAHRKLDAGLRTFTLVIMAATLSELLAGRFPKCEEDDDGCYAEWAAGKSIAYLFAGIPVAREVASSLDTGHRFEGSPLLSVGKELVITGDTGAKLLAGEGDSEKFVKHAMMTAGYAAGIPGLAQLNITGGYAMDLYTGEEEMESPFDARYFLIRKPKE